jgi:hypothetical protein
VWGGLRGGCGTWSTVPIRRTKDMISTMKVSIVALLFCFLLLLASHAVQSKMWQSFRQTRLASTSFRRLWRTAPIGATERGLVQLNSKLPLVQALPAAPRIDKNGDAVLFTDRISRAHLLGGREGKNGDCVQVVADNKTYQAGWNCLYSRLDSVVAANLSCVVVFDNMPRGCLSATRPTPRAPMATQGGRTRSSGVPAPLCPVYTRDDVQARDTPCT